MAEQQLLKRWSYSLWQGWKACAFRVYRTKLCGDREPTNQWLERGIMVHSKAEQFLKGNIPNVPKELANLSKAYANLKRAKPIVEEFWGVDRKWKLSDRNSWVVMKMDAALAPSKLTDKMLFIQDLKTGRQYESHAEQASLYATIGIERFPDAKGVEVEFWYENGDVWPLTYTLDQLNKLKKTWTKRGEEIMAETKFLPNPSMDNCKYCFVRSDRGGVCKAWKKI